MPRILIAYATSHGQTHAIAESLAETLRRAGHTVELADLGAAAPPAPQDYDAVLVGSRVQRERHAPSAYAYVRQHRAALSRLPCFFYSVSLSASKLDAGPDPHRYMARFFEETGWRPDRRIAFAGALAYRRYSWFLRQFMRLVARPLGHSTDTSRDHEYTDWASVARFAEEVAASILPPRRAAYTA